MDETQLEGQEPSSAVEAETPDFLNMSDEDIDKMGMPSFEPDAPEEEAPASDEVEQEGEIVNEEEDLPVEGEEEELDEVEPEQEEVLDEGESEPEEEIEEEDEVVDQVEQSDDGDVDYKAKYEELLAPFKANGKEIKVDNADDLRRLAQMGVGYNAKMAALKPVRKIAKMLENAELLDESKINYLIDLSKHNPDAINKLIKDSGTNPLDINTQSTEDYTPQTYTVDDKQLDLDEALTDLKQSPTYNSTLDVVSTKWDEPSRRVLVDNPQWIRTIDQHMQDGTFKQVNEILDRERLFGRIPAGVSDLDAYNHVFNYLQAQKQTAAPATNTKPKAKAPTPQKRNNRKRAASTSTKPATKQAPTQDFLNMDDSDFEKLMPKYM